jgi:tRNA wybutosine-synthesizing protein 3
MVGIRSMGLGFDSIIGYQDATGKVICVVDAAYLTSVMRIARDRFETNATRTRRFQINLDSVYKAGRKDRSAEELALARASRTERKREEGLARQKEAREAERGHSVPDATSSTPALASLFD